MVFEIMNDHEKKSISIIPYFIVARIHEFRVEGEFV